MAEYIRFEVFIPIYYTSTEVDLETNETRIITRAVDPTLVADFVHDTTKSLS